MSESILIIFVFECKFNYPQFLFYSNQSIFPHEINENTIKVTWFEIFIIHF